MSKPWMMGIALVALVGGIWLIGSRVHEAGLAVREAPQPGYRAPRFSLRNLEGKTLSLSDLQGRAVVLNFWATWCPPCRAEMPAFQRLYARYADQGLMVIGVNATMGDDLAAVLAFRQDYHLTFPILLDETGEVNRSYRVTALPTTFFIDPQGIVRDVVVGGPLSEAAIEARLSTLLPARNR
ncbi:peroxiredoxin [Thermoflexus sp.]|uniref:peroxiredoxin family protein n=1 Tax=Thermoflexus sp. TaxID=1969742 RepID=UPI0025DB6C49|nr:TlpA disulfide reductase family protein [Thermoflexus sp.]MDW8179455.1 TlpA disulfide reductase family protein [Anaerolineae bacterium]MCS6963028.1 TlpA family protein disulfide reductase [Thermoflexus sp.]MCS7350007.1 TlpA family protein disulfide reductase [Thermoflexus sp.]MCX7691278.1 TlpA family protein disulfide reductase [Thermoflexus sp.]MDW8184402.1 TlpA disulfide reductase family protein [Anaerolineae bacterium]